MSHRILLGSSVSLLIAACALSCGADDEKQAVRGEEGGEGGAEPANGGGSPPTNGGAGGEGTAGAITHGGEGGALLGPGGLGGGGVGDDGSLGGSGGENTISQCLEGQTCATNPGSACLLGITECDAVGQSSCIDGEAVAEGTACPGGTCHVGVCLAPFRLFNTGVNDAGVVLEGAAVDPHYILLESAEPTLPGPDAVVATNIAEGYWLAQSETSKWIAPSPNQSYPGATPCNQSGTYVYRTSFDLTGYDPETLTITGGWAADNSGADIRLNGVGLSLPAGSYSPLTPFTIDGGFLPGVNTLDFVVTDIGCPNGLRVELSASDVELLAP